MIDFYIKLLYTYQQLFYKGRVFMYSAYMVVIAAVVVFILLLIYFYNKIINLRNRADEAFSGIDVQYKKRFDLIPNLVQTVQEYMTYEKDTLNHLTELRTKALSGNVSQDEYIKLSEEADKLVKTIMVSAENYPDLKASKNMEILQRSLNEVEEQLAASRRAYNAAVRDLNNGVQMIPTNFFASILHITTREYIEIPANERENVNIRDLFNK